MPDHFVPGRFSGHVAIVTGSSADPSIGRACAMRLGREGAAVVINGRDAERLGATAAALADLEVSVAAVGGSMEDDTTAHALVEAARERFGGVDLVVNTIGGTRARLGRVAGQVGMVGHDCPQHVADDCPRQGRSQ